MRRGFCDFCPAHARDHLWVCFSKPKLSEAQFGGLERFERNLKVGIDIIPRRLEMFLFAFLWRGMGLEASIQSSTAREVLMIKFLLVDMDV